MCAKTDSETRNAAKELAFAAKLDNAVVVDVRAEWFHRDDKHVPSKAPTPNHSSMHKV